MVAQYLQERFSDTEFDFINAGIPSTGSTPGAFRLANDVLSKGTVDLLFEEAAVNDYHNGRSVTEQIRGMEGIVRYARHLVELVFFANAGIADTDAAMAKPFIKSRLLILFIFFRPFFRS